jgi:magnesium-transporting ATPase (P-type)
MYKIVVGDVIVLEPGCIIPADCLLIDGNDIEVDESPLELRDGETHVKKSIATSESFRDKDPFLYSGSILLKGTGKALVCVVGD